MLILRLTYSLWIKNLFQKEAKVICLYDVKNNTETAALFSSELNLNCFKVNILKQNMVIVYIDVITILLNSFLNTDISKINI